MRKKPMSDYEICSRYTMSIEQNFGEHGVDLVECNTSFYRNEDGNLVIDVETYSNSKMRPCEYKTHSYKALFKKDFFVGDYIGIGMSGVEFIS